MWQLQGAEQNMDLEPGPHLSSKRTASEESETLIPVSSVLSEEQKVRFSRLYRWSGGSPHRAAQGR